ncbi:hypothetical protein PGB28_15965 [Primorskyibacter aestuariivivens]|uniref:hypothetical protein n=1 Tax=Primorskyibacter aestuariivivens TaxID=1888912 RepID=UPI0022FFD4E4|nr:hypothetical protein [Primorskyibacter aestuariivivens]MDA7429962.1 hypothetical protein [Primorskyibacter aestuariivivens]
MARGFGKKIGPVGHVGVWPARKVHQGIAKNVLLKLNGHRHLTRYRGMISATGGSSENTKKLQPHTGKESPRHISSFVMRLTLGEQGERNGNNVKYDSVLPVLRLIQGLKLTHIKADCPGAVSL